MRWAGNERDHPIQLPLGRQLVTLRDADNYVTKLPKAEHGAADWQATMGALTLVATSGDPTMFARIGVIAGVEPPPVASLIRRNHGRFWGRRKLNESP
jgi:hypothetical protein